MAIRLVFLGKLADLAGAPAIEVAGPLDWPRLLAALPQALGAVAAGDKVKFAINGAILADKAELSAKDGDEIALLPPVSGG